MLTINGLPKKTCAGISRRQMLQIGGAGLFGLTLPKILAAETSREPFTGGRAKSVIFLFLFGGPSQLETFDMKPDAPREIRGPFSSIRSRTPDLLMCEHLGRLAKISDKFGIIRTMTHDYNDHGAAHYIQTGKRWQFPMGSAFSASPQDWPSMGSVVEYLSQHQRGGMERDLASYVAVPNWLGRLQQRGQYRRPGQYGGWLGSAYNPMTTVINKRDLEDNPYWRDCTDDELTFEIEGLRPSVPLGRLQQRASLLTQFEAVRTRIDAGEADALDVHRKRALALVSADRTGHALDIRRESDGMRDRYGRHLFGQSCLMARRLVEAGTRFVTVHYDSVDGYSWDSHIHSDDVKNHLLPTFDQACSALLTDLDERGLLHETLVVAVGEMGRTPVANANWGRGHWSMCFPALLAGAGIRGGIVYGKTDAKAAYPTEHPVTPEDLAKTIYWALGIDPELMLMNRENRPVPIVESGKPLMELFGYHLRALLTTQISRVHSDKRQIPMFRISFASLSVFIFTMLPPGIAATANAADAGPEDAVKLAPVLGEAGDWNIRGAQGAADWKVQETDARPALLTGPNGAIITSRASVPIDSEITAIFRMVSPENKGVSMIMEAGLTKAAAPHLQALGLSLSVPAGPDMNYVNWSVATMGRAGAAWRYWIWNMPKSRQTWADTVRWRVEEDINSTPKLIQKWITIKYVLRDHAARVYLDGRLLQESAAPNITCDGFVRLTLRNGMQLASLKVRPLPPADPRFETVELDHSLNSSKFAGQDFTGLPVGGKKVVDDVPFVFPSADAKGNNHIDLKPSWLRAGFIPDGGSAYSVDSDAARWIGTFGPDPARIQFRVANARYLNLHLLAAADGTANTVPIVTAQFFRTGAGQPVNFQTRVPLFTATSQASSAIPLRLANGQEGRAFLVTIPLEPESLSYFSDTDTVEVELTKQVQLYRAYPDPMYCSSHAAGLPSGVHVFAMTLERPAVDFDFEPDRFAHIWTAPDKAGYTLTLRNTGSTEQKVTVALKTLSHDGTDTTQQNQEVTVPANAQAVVKLPLSFKKYGHHNVSLTVTDDQGTRTRSRSLSYLHADTRERGDWEEGKGIIYGFWDWKGNHVTPKGLPRLQAATDAGIESTMDPFTNYPEEEKPFIQQHKMVTRYLAYQLSPIKAHLGVEWDATKPGEMATAVVNAIKKKPYYQTTPYNQPQDAVFLAEPLLGPISYMSLPEYYGEGPYQLTPVEEKNLKKYMDFLLIAGGAIKKEWPNARILLPWGIANFPIAFLRASKEAAALIDGPAIDMAPFSREAELQMGQVTLHNEMWQLQEEWKKHSPKPWPRMITVEGPGISPARPGMLTADEQAQNTNRSFLALMAYNVTQMNGCPVIFHCAGAWGETHYGGGLCEPLPILSPNVAYSAFATLTRQINRVNYVKWVTTGSHTVFCLQFKHYKTGELVHVMWTLRGTRPVSLALKDGAAVNVFDSMDNDTTIRATNGQATLTVTAAPCFIHGLTEDPKISLGEPDHSDAKPAETVARVASMGDGSWKLNNDRDDYLESAHAEFVRHFPSKMTSAIVEAPNAQGKKALSIHLEKPEKDRFVMPYYAMLTPAKPITIQGKASHLGLWVKGASDWGRVVYFLRDAKGEPWVSVGTKDQWNCDDTRAWSQFCFDSWRYLPFELPANAPYDCFREAGTTWWGQQSGSGDGIADLPLTIEKIAVERRTHVIHVNELLPANPEDVLLGDLFAEYASPDDATARAVELSKLRMPQATAAGLLEPKR